MAAGLIAGPTMLVESAQAAGPELITNGSFEAPDIPTGSFGIFASIPGWSLDPASVGTGTEIQDHVAGAPAAGAGDQFVELDSNGPSGYYQDIATVAGRRYELTFLYSARPNTLAADNHFLVTAGPDTVEIGPLSSATTTNWQPHAVSFVANGPTTRIEFFDLGPQQASGGLGAYIDEVSVVEADADYRVCVLYDQSKAHRSGSTVPIKLQLCDSAGNNLSSPAIVIHAASLTKLDGSASSAVEDSGAANPDDDFRYDADLGGTGGYIFNKSTVGLSSGTWVLAFTVDGVGHSSYQVQFDVR